MKIAAVVIWFNPEKNMVANILTYSKYVFKTVIIDNSTCNNSALVVGERNIEYIPLEKNIGIAAALNIGYLRVEEMGMEWVLTMDQDSSFLESDIKYYLDPNALHFKQFGVAVFGPNFEGPITSDLIDCKSVISSGSLVSLAAHKKNSGYNENLFIDQVDHEYCFRLKRLSYRIIRLGYISMSHTVGLPLAKKKFGRIFVSHNHNAIRKYYMTRNTLYMRRHYKEFNNKNLKIIFMDIINIILIEEDKFNKLKSIIKGFLDYFKGRMGPMDA
jgi:rhamnosyltransferase